MGSCAALTTKYTQWDLCPSLGASGFFTALFFITLICHIGQAFYHKTWYAWVIVISAGLQVATYLIRDLSITHPATEIYYILWFVLMLIAPIWTNAFVYMVFGRMVWRYKGDRQILRIRAWHYSTIYVILDIVAFLIQVSGATQASGSHISNNQIMRGLHLYMGGIGFQQIFIFFFCVAVYVFWRDTREYSEIGIASRSTSLVYTLVAVLGLITVRIIFRLIEYSNGLKSSIPRHEAFQYVFDSLPMLIALVLFNLIHPGRIMPAEETKLPSFRQRRRMKREGVGFEMRSEPQLLPKPYTGHQEDISAEYD